MEMIHNNNLRSREIKKEKRISKNKNPWLAANFTVVVKFKAREIENEIGQNLQMEFCVNTADN